MTLATPSAESSLLSTQTHTDAMSVDTDEKDGDLTESPLSSAAAAAADSNDGDGDDDMNDERIDAMNMFQRVTDYKTEGNAAFAQRNYEAAKQAYDKGIQLLSQTTPATKSTTPNGLTTPTTSVTAATTDASTNTIIQNVNDQTWTDLRVVLLRNRAQCLIKLQDFLGAEVACSLILERYHVPSAKAFHRRAVAREGRAHQIVSQMTNQNDNPNHHPYEQQKAAAVQLLHLAKADLQAAAACIQPQPGQKSQQPQSVEDATMTEAQKQKQMVEIAQAAQRLQHALAKLSNPKATKSSNRSHVHATPRITPASNTATITSSLPATASAAFETKNDPVEASGKAAATTTATSTTPTHIPPSSTSPVNVPQRHRLRRRQGNSSPAVVAQGSEPAPTKSALSRVQQRQDVLRLLLSRQTQLGMNTTAKAGEAFYVVDWYWWSDFCQHVDLFYRQATTGPASSTTTMATANQSHYHNNKQRNMVLAALPPGAIVPGEQDGEDDGNDNYDGPPGPIDNSALFLLPDETKNQQAYHLQWYRTAVTPEVSPSGNRDKQKEETAAKEPQLLPNLVRGYDYEVLPREVYHALREWYGEVTPSICRRAIPDGASCMMIQLYPEVYTAVPLLLPWNTNLYERCSACRRPGVRARCRRCGGATYCDRTCQQAHWAFHKQHCQPVGSEETPNFVPHSEGRVGLVTLGNTCFMNSAVQCLSHTAPLTRHFLSGKYAADLNRTNPLGTGGKLADAYAMVLQELWMRPGDKIPPVKPYALKRAIALFAPRFAGTLQHDAQEFLAYLLDGLHEDLNRVRKAPYVEMPDFQDGQNMRVAGARAWEAHMRRNDSLVLSSFYGQFKSTCVCPRCNRISVSFDAFNHVSLEIPLNQPIVPIIVLLVRAANQDGPVMPERLGIPFRKSNPLVELKKDLSKHCGIPVANLHLAQLRENEIVHIYNDDETARTISANDFVVAYEAAAFDDQFFHALVRHKLPSSPEITNDSAFFGLPLLSSFPVNATCQQVWQHFARLVQDKVKNPGAVENAFQLILHNNKGEHWKAFPSDDASVDENDSENAKTGIVPKDSDELIRNYLGAQAHENFVPLWIEWRDVRLGADGGDREQEFTPEQVEEGSFLNVRDHPSYLEALEKLCTEGTTNKVVTLDECFQTFIKPERLDERNMWYCSKCKDHVRAMKTMELWRLPDVLVVHLKRFEFRNVLRRDKLETFVDFPVAGLDMGRHCGSSERVGFVDEQTPAIYDLFGVINHYGRMGFGHYTAFCREWNEFGEMNSWSLFDDSVVSAVVGNKVVSPAAYVLFYRRRPLGPQ